MKYLLFVLLMFGVCKPSFSQTVIAADRENTLYAGIDNPVTVVSQNHNYKSITLSADSGTVTGADGHYLLHFANPGRVTVYVNTKKGNKTIYKQYFRVKPIPPATIYLLNKTGGKISIQEIRKAFAPHAQINGFDFDLKVTIDGFTVIVIRNDKVIFCKYVHESKYGARFSDETAAEQMIQALQVGDKLKLTDIACRYPDPKYNGPAAALEFTITE